MSIPAELIQFYFSKALNGLLLLGIISTGYIV